MSNPSDRKAFPIPFITRHSKHLALAIIWYASLPGTFQLQLEYILIIRLPG